MALSVGKAWDETKAIVARDGKAMVILVAALIMLPSALTALLNPQTAEMPVDADAGSSLVEFAMALVIQVGTLAVTAIALRPSLSVGEAIRLGGAKLFPVIGALLIFVVPMLILLVFILMSTVGLVDAADLQSRLSAGQLGGTGVLLILLWCAVLLYFGVRFMLVSPVAINETSNPMAMLKRSWSLTSGHFWRLAGFLLMLVVAIILVMAAVGAVIGVLAALVFGDVEPMSLAALLIGLATGAVNAAFVLVYATMVARIYDQVSAAPSVPHVEAD